MKNFLGRYSILTQIWPTQRPGPFQVLVFPSACVLIFQSFSTLVPTTILNDIHVFSTNVEEILTLYIFSISALFEGSFIKALSTKW